MKPSELPVTICSVKTPDGFKDYVTLSAVGAAFKNGLAPAEIVGALIQPIKDGGAVVPANFARNRVFVELLHRTIAKHGPSVSGLVAAAKQQREGWVHIIDGRTPTPQGAVPPEDIIGAFQVRGGQIIPGSYQQNSNHKILSTQGFLCLDPAMQEFLLSEVSASAQQGAQADGPAPGGPAA